uniref:Cadherin domain-containing protein n=1 Tax=Mesocestoides corti TaxID=53468 RepID=A0A5K3EQH2_MESCO
MSMIARPSCNRISNHESACLKIFPLKSGFISDPSFIPFSIDSDGWVMVTGSIDREATPLYELTVTVSDTFDHTSVVFLTIEVFDLNDTPPEWQARGEIAEDSPSSEIHVLENQVPNQPVFTFPIKDSDSRSDSALMKFYQVGGSVQQFAISTTGKVYVRTPLDAESSESYVLLVKAFDGVHATSRPFELKILVDDINDNSPVCHVPDRETEVLESAPPGTVLFRLNATDADVLDEHSVLTYHLSERQDDVAVFNVDANSGVVTLAWKLDYETKKSYFLKVDARDKDSQFCHYNLHVYVLDVNDNAPVFEQPITITPVPEDAPVGSLIGKVHATDADSVDANGLEYSLATPTNANFSVDKSSGLLRVAQPLDRETLAVHELVVVVADGGALQPRRHPSHRPHRRHTATASVTIRLVDVNDSPPQFTEPRPHASVSELTPVGSLVMQLTAISLDEGENAVVRYRLLEDQPEFTLNSTTGELYLTSALDYEHTPRFFLTIEAKDGGSPPLSSTTIATINVIDVNDNRPYFIGQDSLPLADNHTASTDSHVGLFTFEAYENSPVGTQIGRITAGDADSGVNGRLSYAFCDPNRQPDVVFTYPSAPQPPAVSRLFRIGESKGELSFLFTPDREEVSEYRFAVCVSDHGDPVQSAMTEVRVIIRDTNDCQPHFERGNFEVYVQVDRNGNIVATNEPSDLRNISQLNADEVLLSHLAVTDLDTFPNAGPFRCELSGFVVSPTALRDSSAPLFSVRSNPTLPSNDTTAPPSFRGLEPHQTGFCSVYAARILPLGSKSLVVHVYDNGMTALQSTATLTVHVSRQSNLPPEIVSSNSTLVVFRNITGSSLGPRFDLGHSMTSTKSQKLHDVPVMRVTVRDRTAYDQLFFELLEPAAPQFVIDQYDGSIRLRPRLEPGRSVTAPPPQSDPSVSWLEPALPKLPPAAQVNSGDYRLQVKVTNGSLSTNDTMFVKVITVTEEMLESACVLHVSELSPNELFILHLDTVIKEELARSLLLDPSARDASLNSNVYIISAQQSSMFLRREKRSVGGGGGGGVDLLIAVYDPLERSFIEPGHLVQSIHAMQANLSRIVGHQVHAFNSLCAQKKCESGSCVTRVILDAQSEPNVFEVHGVSHVSPRFALLATCRCPANFAGGACDRPLSVCASVACRAPRVCVASPTAPGVHACVCPPPLTGANCEVLNRPSADPKACFSETCFQQRENGPLQFTGGSFIHWQVAKPGEHKIEIAFSIRTRQQSGPLLSINWNVLRSLRIRLIENGNLAVSPVDFVSGVPTTDWLVSGTPRLNDGHWHRVRFTLFASASEQSDLQWWAELTIDGIHTYLENVDWAPGDTESQDVLFGAELVHGFRPLPEVFFPKDWVATTPDEPLDAAWPNFNYSAPPAVLRSGFVGCIRNVLIDRVKPPYQLGLTPQQTVLFSRQNHKPIAGVPDGQLPVGGVPALQVVRTLNLDYHCLARATYDGSCAYAPCRNGGTCVSHRALAFSQLGKGPAAVGPSDFNCTCQRDFQGPRCEVVTDPCALQPCRNGASCRSVGTRMPGQPTSYTCVCPPGFSGAHCDRSDAANGSSACAHAEALLSHQSPVCHHGARCQDAPSGPFCACPLGWRGGRCEHDLDECLLASEAFADDVGDNVSAQSANPLCNPYASHRGVCINLPGSYQCNCSLGYAGRNCQIRNLTPLKPDSNALGLTLMHGYIIAGIFALIFLLAVVTVIVLTCCFRRRSSNFYVSRNACHTNSSFIPWGGKVVGTSPYQQQQKMKLLETARMLPDGGDSSVNYSPSRTGMGGSMILNPSGHLLTSDVRRQSYLVDDSGRLMVLRPSSVVGGPPGEPVQMLYLGGGAAGSTISPVPAVGHVPASSTMTRRSFLDPSIHHKSSYGANPITPQHLSQAHLVTTPGAYHRPGSSNTMTSDRISLGSGSDQFSVQSGGQRQPQQHQQQQQPVLLPPQTSQQPIFYVYPQSAACVRRSQVIQPHHVPPEAITPLFYRSRNSVGNLSASGRTDFRDQRLSLFGIVGLNGTNQVIPLQALSNGSMRPASSLNLVPGTRPPPPASPPTVQSRPYWAESTLSLLPPIPPPSTANQNGRASLYRKAVHACTSNADLRRSSRLGKQRNSLAADGASQPKLAMQRPLSVCTPLILPAGSGEACSGPLQELEGAHWEQQNGSPSSSAFVIAEPRGLQKFPASKRPSPPRRDSSSNAVPPVQSSATPDGVVRSPTDGTLKPTSRGMGDGEEPSSQTFKTNGLTPRPKPPNVLMVNGDDPAKNDQLKSTADSTNVRKPLLDTTEETPTGTPKNQQ